MYEGWETDADLTADDMREGWEYMQQLLSEDEAWAAYLHSQFHGREF